MGLSTFNDSLAKAAPQHQHLIDHGWKHQKSTPHEAHDAVHWENTHDQKGHDASPAYVVHHYEHPTHGHIAVRDHDDSWFGLKNNKNSGKGVGVDSIVKHLKKLKKKEGTAMKEQINFQYELQTPLGEGIVQQSVTAPNINTMLEHIGRVITEHENKLGDVVLKITEAHYGENVVSESRLESLNVLVGLAAEQQRINTSLVVVNEVSHGSVAAKVRDAKEKNPDHFCKHPGCLWRTVQKAYVKGPDGTMTPGTKDNPCQKHPVKKTVSENLMTVLSNPKKVKKLIAELKLPDLEVDDILKVGKFKNRSAKIKGFSTDEHGQPVADTDKGEQKIFKPRIAKLEPSAEDKPVAEGQDPTGPMAGMHAWADKNQDLRDAARKKTDALKVQQKAKMDAAALKLAASKQKTAVALAKPVVEATESEDPKTHETILADHGFSASGDTWNHPDGHQAKKHGSKWELKGKTWNQTMPAHDNPKFFKQSVVKLLNQKPSTKGPKAGQSAVPDSKGNYRTIKPR